MLDSSVLSFKPYVDNRVKTHPGFIEGLSGPLKMATDKVGRRYIVKYAQFHNAANELVASWLGYKIGAPVPHSYLLKPSEKFPSMYGVAIGFIDNLKPFDLGQMTVQEKADVCSQIALALLIDTDDNLQMSESGGRIYSIDFSEAFFVSDTLMLKAFLFNEGVGIQLMQSKLSAFQGYISRLNFDLPDFAEQLHFEQDELKNGIIAAARKVLDITEDEIQALSDELMETYPAGYAVYYEECIHAMQEKMKNY